MQGGAGSLTPEQYELANRALAALDIAGFYCAKKYVREKDFLELWAPALVTLKRSAAPFLAHRDAQRPGAVPVWPYYRRLTEQSEKYLRSRGVSLPSTCGFGCWRYQRTVPSCLTFRSSGSDSIRSTPSSEPSFSVRYR